MVDHAQSPLPLVARLAIRGARLHTQTTPTLAAAAAAVSHFLAVLAWIGSSCLRHCVHGVPIGGGGGSDGGGGGGKRGGRVVVERLPRSEWSVPTLHETAVAERVCFLDQVFPRIASSPSPILRVRVEIMGLIIPRTD
jgi:hypothetical protein